MSKEESEKTPEADVVIENTSGVEESGSEKPDAIEVDSTVMADTEDQSLEIARLEAELSEVKDQYIRKAADMENFRKRLLRDKEDAVSFANRSLLNDLVTVIDDFERAIKSSEQSKDYATLHNGVAIIEQQFVSMLERKYGLKRVDSIGAEFNPDMHEAIMMEDRDDHESSIVLEDYQKGYLLNEKVLRAAKVKVSRPTKV